MKGGTPIHIIAAAGPSSLKPLGAEREDTPPGGWAYWMTGCFLTLEARCSQRLLPPSSVSSCSVTTICHFLRPQGLKIVCCPVASPLTQTHAPLWPLAPLFSRESNKEALFFPEDKNIQRTCQGSPSASSLKELALYMRPSRDGTSSVLLGILLHVFPVPFLQMRTLRFRGREGSQSKDWGS